MLAPSKIMIAQVWGTFIYIEHSPLMHMVATLDSLLELSLFFNGHWPIASLLVVGYGELSNLSTH